MGRDIRACVALAKTTARDEAFARVRGYLCDAAAICAGYREHVGPPSKPWIRDLQRALWGGGHGRVGRTSEDARGREGEGADEGARKVKEDWGDVGEEAW